MLIKTISENRLIEAINDLATFAALTAEKRGKTPKDFDAGMADIMEELAEAMCEDSSHYRGPDGKPEGFLVELGDALLAILTLMKKYHYPDTASPGGIISEKMKYNITRKD